MCVYAKPPFAGPEAVLAYLARYTHRVAISNSRLIALDERGVNFRYKDYRRNARARYRTMTLAPDEFIRRFLLHVLPKGLHRIRHDHRRDLRARGRTPRPAIARGDHASAKAPWGRPPDPVGLEELHGGTLDLKNVGRAAGGGADHPVALRPHLDCSCAVNR